MFRDILHQTVDFVCDDLKENTLTNIATGGIGGAVGGKIAHKAATVGFTMGAKNVARKTIVGSTAGVGTGVLGNMTGLGSNPKAIKVFKFGNKVGDIEKWFDTTPVGKAIDNEISYVQHRSHAVIDRTFNR